MGYIIDEEKRREMLAARHLLAVPPIRERLLGPLGLSDFSWVLLELRLPKVVPGLEGEIDILAGRLSFDDHDAFERERAGMAEQSPNWHPSLLEFMAAKAIAERRGIAWPPPLDYIVGVEVKCAYNDGETIKSQKASPEKVRGVRKQIARDLSLGLDRVALLDIIGNPPTDGPDGIAWLDAGVVGRDSAQCMSAALAGRLTDYMDEAQGIFVAVPELSSAGQFFWSPGSVVGGDESIRGTGAPVQLRPASPNHRTHKRAIIEDYMQAMLARFPRPASWPVVLEDCVKCNQIHSVDSACR